MAARNSGRLGTGVVGHREGAGVSAICVKGYHCKHVEYARPVIRTRLAQAVVRLAWMLNESFLR